MAQSIALSFGTGNCVCLNHDRCSLRPLQRGIHETGSLGALASWRVGRRFEESHQREFFGTTANRTCRCVVPRSSPL